MRPSQRRASLPSYKERVSREGYAVYRCRYEVRQSLPRDAAILPRLHTVRSPTTCQFEPEPTHFSTHSLVQGSNIIPDSNMSDSQRNAVETTSQRDSRSNAQTVAPNGESVEIPSKSRTASSQASGSRIAVVFDTLLKKIKETYPTLRMWEPSVDALLDRVVTTMLNGYLTSENAQARRAARSEVGPWGEAKAYSTVMTTADAADPSTVVLWEILEPDGCFKEEFVSLVEQIANGFS